MKEEQIDVEAVYMPFVQQILQALSSNPLVLAMDGSQIGRGGMVLLVGVLFKRRVLPIAWILYRENKGHTTAQRHIQALEKVQPLIPIKSEVVLLGDAEYDTTEMMVLVQENTNWQYVLRDLCCGMCLSIENEPFCSSKMNPHQDKCGRRESSIDWCISIGERHLFSLS